MLFGIGPPPPSPKNTLRHIVLALAFFGALFDVEALLRAGFSLELRYFGATRLAHFSSGNLATLEIMRRRVGERQKYAFSKPERRVFSNFLQKTTESHSLTPVSLMGELFCGQTLNHTQSSNLRKSGVIILGYVSESGKAVGSGSAKKQAQFERLFPKLRQSLMDQIASPQFPPSLGLGRATKKNSRYKLHSNSSSGWMREGGGREL